MVEDSIGYARRSEVEDQDAFVVEVGVEELDRFGDVDAKFLEDGRYIDTAASALSLRAHRKGVSHGRGCRFKAEPIVCRVEKHMHRLWLAHFFKSGPG